MAEPASSRFALLSMASVWLGPLLELGVPPGHPMALVVTVSHPTRGPVRS